MSHRSSSVSAALAAACLAGAALCGCGASTYPVMLHFEGFTEHARQGMVVRWVENGKEILGTRQSAGIDTGGRVNFEFALAGQTPYTLQYFCDANGNGKWDGPVDSGEHSWSRNVSIPSPIHNRDTLTVTVGHDGNHAALPDDFVAP